MIQSNIHPFQKDRYYTSPEPIAIIGLGCRFPGGADDWRSFWQLLDSARDAISETPAERWNLQKFYAPNGARPGKTQSKWGGYVSDIDAFDPQFFGISPREAASMDPQQRMLLEVAFRALEDGGQPLEQIAGQPVSVFVGISSIDYAMASLSLKDRGVIDAYSNTGGSSSIAANRISYCFDLRGPSVAVDTACSSSLVAVHLACESIWSGGAPMALAGGVNALLMPDFYVAFSQLGVLSPDGRCKSFDARADGYVRSEGAGMALLKPLSAALRDKDPIYAVIRATALNQDGRTPGMTVPSQAAQQQLLQVACDRAHIRPRDIQYIEAHGTGTPVGDPIEARALGAILGQDRDPSQPCIIGSVKTNIGHLEAGAGIASLMKVALALHHRRIPAHLHFREPNPAIDFDALRLRVPRESCNWESISSRLAGINGFGYGGANAHVILEQAPEAAATFKPPRMPHNRLTMSPAGDTKKNGSAPLANDISSFSAPVLFPLSARSKPALVELAGAYADWLERHGEEYPLAEIAGYVARRRSHHNCRATACASNVAEMIVELRSLAASSSDELAGDLSGSELSKGAAFVCSGQGPQWWGMGRGLLTYSPVFRSMIKHCDSEFSKYGNWSLQQELTRPEVDSRMHRTSIAQPSIFAIQVALAAVWESWGVKPAYLVGHSVGEIAAAYLSGALGWEDACCVAFHRGRTMDLASSQGAMLAAGLSADEVPAWLEGIETEVSLAAINGPSSVTISGAAQAIELLAQRLEGAGVFCRRLAVEYAFHSPQMDSVREELLRALAHIQPRATHTPLISTVTGTLIDGSNLNAEYWWRNVRQSVRFSDAMAYLSAMGCSLAIEVGPHPVLAYSINECFQGAGSFVRTIPSLSRQLDDLQCMTKSLGSLYSIGFDIDWAGFYAQPVRRIHLPTYPFQRQRCWSESLESRISRMSEESHPLLGESIEGPTPQWQQRIDPKLQSYLADHVVRGVCVYPAAAMIETAIAAACAVGQTESARLERVRLHNPCVIGDDRPQWIQTDFDEKRRQLTLAFRPCDDPQWSSLATIDVRAEPVSDPPEFDGSYRQRIEEIRARCNEAFDPQRLYDHCRKIGLQYGAAFQGVVSGSRRDGEAIVEISLPNAVVSGDYRKDDYFVHPALLDSCFHGMIAANIGFDGTVDGMYLPSEIRQVIFYRRPADRLVVHIGMSHKSGKLMICDLDLFNPDGQLCLSLKGFESRRVGGGMTAETTEDLLYSYSWVEQPLPPAERIEPGAAAKWIVFTDEAGVGLELNRRLRERGDRVIEIYRDGSHLAQAAVEDVYLVDPESVESFSQALTGSMAVLDCGLSGVSGVIYLWGLDAPGAHSLTATSLEQSTRITALAPLYLVQAWERLPDSATAALTLVTASAQSADGRPELTQVAQSPLIGFGRVIASEYARLPTKLVDLSSTIAASDVDNLLLELLTGDEEDEVMWRSGRRWVHRFSQQTSKPVSVEAARTLPCQLRVGTSAGIDELHYQTRPVRDPGDREVEIEVLACGLNFSDVMKALDLYPGLPDGPIELGAECSGRITRVGPHSRWNVGDEVIAVAPGSFGTHVTVDESLVARKPDNLTHQQAATIPIAFLTADYALDECARLKCGDSILIHSASGGVGLAAIQLARSLGIQVLATAGTDEKRRFVLSLGASHVMDSRSLDFGEETLRATAGLGVDAVLNSLPGEAIKTGLSVLKSGGRFLEIGKRDIYADEALGLYPFRNNLAMFAIDLDQLFKLQPQRMGDRLRRIVERLERGELKPLPITTYSADETKAAFRFMQQGRHIGKVAVTYDRRPSDVRAGDYLPIAFDGEGTYWIAGGWGGFGLEIVRWMIAHGARSLVLSGRGQTPPAAARKAIADWEANGTRIHNLPADITRPDDVRRVMATIDEELPPLRGVFHTAMVLEDKLLVDLDRATLERVLRPKVLGGWNLHRETLGRELDCFVLFSSLSSIFGHAGQANYSAANALLDSLVYFRRAQGLPGTVINWGHLGEVGYLAQREQLGQRLERQGVLSFSVKQATDCLEYAMQNKSLQLSVLRIDWSTWRGLGITNRVSPRFAHLLRLPKESDSPTGGEFLSAENLRAITGEERFKLVERMLRTKAGVLLGIPADQIAADRALLEMGLDSLMAVEMRNWIECQMEIGIPISDLMRGESLTQIVRQLCAAIEATRVSTAQGESNGNSTLPIHPIADYQAEALLEQLPNLGADEVAQLLDQMLREP